MPHTNSKHKLTIIIIIITIIIINGLDKSNSYNIHRPAVNSVWSGIREEVVMMLLYKQTSKWTHTHTQNHDEDTKKYYTSKERDIFIK